ncbi:hypothetical protein MMPV_001905 [Pyropia vietnamensis]
MLGPSRQQVAHVVAFFTNAPDAFMFTADQEAMAARMYASFIPRISKAMRSAGRDEAVGTQGDKRIVEVRNVLSRATLANSKVGEGGSGATTESTSSEEDEAETARQTPTELIAQPSNNVLDSAGDDEAVQAVTDDVAAITARATCAVARYTNHVSASIHAGDDAEADARREYDNVSDASAKAMWIAGQDTAAGTSGHSTNAKTCEALARKVLEVAAAAEAPTSTQDGDTLPETDIPEATYWFVGRTVEGKGTTDIKAFADSDSAQKLFNSSRTTSSALLLMSNPWTVSLDNAKDETLVEELRAEMEGLVASVHRVVASNHGDHAEATLYEHSESMDARAQYGSLPSNCPRSMWTAKDESAVASSGNDKAGKLVANSLAQAIPTIADTPEPAPEPIRYSTVAFYRDDEVIIKAYDTVVESLVSCSVSICSGRNTTLSASTEPRDLAQNAQAAAAVGILGAQAQRSPSGRWRPPARTSRGDGTLSPHPVNTLARMPATAMSAALGSHTPQSLPAHTTSSAVTPPR